MKTNILLLTLTIIGFSSCATFKSGQTPDDVYYSPTRANVQNEENKQETKKRNNLQLRRSCFTYAHQ